MVFGTPSVPMPRISSGVEHAGFYSDLAFLKGCPGLAPESFTVWSDQEEREVPRSKSLGFRGIRCHLIDHYPPNILPHGSRKN
jgi:hypothetical protein